MKINASQCMDRIRSTCVPTLCRRASNKPTSLISALASIQIDHRPGRPHTSSSSVPWTTCSSARRAGSIALARLAVGVAVDASAAHASASHAAALEAPAFAVTARIEALRQRRRRAPLAAVAAAPRAVAAAPRAADRAQIEWRQVRVARCCSKRALRAASRPASGLCAASAEADSCIGPPRRQGPLTKRRRDRQGGPAPPPPRAHAAAPRG